jgi:hypothetical protein
MSCVLCSDLVKPGRWTQESKGDCAMMDAPLPGPSFTEAPCRCTPVAAATVTSTTATTQPANKHSQPLRRHPQAAAYSIASLNAYQPACCQNAAARQTSKLAGMAHVLTEPRSQPHRNPAAIIRRWADAGASPPAHMVNHVPATRPRSRTAWGGAAKLTPAAVHVGGPPATGDASFSGWF